MAQQHIYENLINTIDLKLCSKKTDVAEIAGGIVNTLFSFEQEYGHNYYLKNQSLSNLFDIATEMEWQPEAYDNKIEAMRKPFEEFKKQIEHKHELGQ